MSKPLFEQGLFKEWINTTKEFYGEKNLKKLYQDLGDNPAIKPMTINQHRRLVGRAYRLVNIMIEPEEREPAFNVWVAFLYLFVCCDANKYHLDHNKLAEMTGIYGMMEKYGIKVPGLHKVRKNDTPPNEKEGSV